MNIEVFDVAVHDYFKDLFKNTVWGSPTNAFRQLSLKDDKGLVELPALTVNRTDIQFNRDTHFGQLKRGHLIRATRGQGVRERVIPLLLTYQLDIWARDKEDSLGILSEVMFYIQDNPAVKIKGDKQPNAVENYLEVTEIIDNSDVSLELTRGRLARQTIMMTLRAHIYKFEDVPIFTVEAELVPYDSLFKDVDNS